MVKERLSVKNLVIVSIFTALIAIGAFIRVPIPYVPFTLQFLFTMLAGILLGGKLGMISVLIYISLGLIGVPVFTEGGGLFYIFKPSFGYLIGFALASFATGTYIEKAKEINFKNIFIANLIGLVIVYVFGSTHCYLVAKYVNGLPMTLKELFLYCFVLIIPGDLFLCFIAAWLGKKILPHIN